MTKPLTLLLLFIGLAWGQLKVKSRYDLESFTVDDIGFVTSLEFKNGKLEEKKEDLDIEFYGYVDCIDNICSLNISYSKKFKLEKNKKENSKKIFHN